MAAEHHLDLALVTRRIIDWYKTVKKPLPWRQDPTPYHVWISEIMLQQTRIEAVIPYYHRFLDALPDAVSLAAVDPERLMKLWEGLGYYSRARHLKEAAEQIVTEWGGELPRRAADLKRLAGIGDYTAGAIASIAYGEPEPAVDGNVLRVMMRLAACEDDVMQPATRKRVAAELAAVYPTGRDAGALTEGLMELGETVCLPNGTPLCGDCPLRDLCLGFGAGDPERFPTRSKPKPRRIEPRTVFLIRAGDSWALHRRPGEGLLGGMWEFPNTEGHLSEKEARAWLAGQGVSVTELSPCGKAKHVFSHIEWHMIGYTVTASSFGSPFVPMTGREIADAALPTAFSAFRRLLG